MMLSKIMSLSPPSLPPLPAVPLEAPMDVGVVLLNSTAIRVTWAAVDRDTVRGHLLGYKVLAGPSLFVSSSGTQ